MRGSGAGHLKHVASALQAEEEACDVAIETASAWGMTCVQVELDSKELVKALTSRESDLAAEGIIFRDIREVARLNVSQISFSFAPRDCNALAHAVAAFGAKRPAAREIWLEALPDDVCSTDQ